MTAEPVSTKAMAAEVMRTETMSAALTTAGTIAAEGWKGAGLLPIMPEKLLPIMPLSLLPNVPAREGQKAVQIIRCRGHPL